jgi:uncharacterized membrane protein YdfJ with MMPL/SSD domain
VGRALHRVGRFCAAHPLPVLLTWIVIAAGVVGAMSALGSMTTNDQSLPGTQSQQASDLLAANFPPQQNGSNPIVFHVVKGKLTNADNKNAIEASYKALLKQPAVYSATDPFKNSAAGLVSTDGRTAFIPVLLRVSNGQVTESLAQRIFSATAPAQKQGIEVAVGGTMGSALSPSPTESSEVVGLATAMVILAITFGSLIAMGLPILTALIGLLTALGTIGLLSRVTTIPTVGPTLATMIGLGVGIDYSLFLITKYRHLHEGGLDHHEAIANAVSTAGGAIVFAGSTVVIALLSLSVAGIPLVSALGYATAVAVVTAVCAALTMLPAVISLLGKHVFGARLPGFRRSKSKPASGPTVWQRWARLVTSHPWIASLIAVAVLIPLVIPLFSLNLGQEDIGVTPKDTTERQAFDLMSNGFGPGYNGPLVVAVQLSPVAKPSQQYETTNSQAHALQSDLQNKQKLLTNQSNALKAQQASLEKQQQQLEAQKASLLAQQAQLLAQKQQLENQAGQLQSQAAALRGEPAALQQQRAAIQQQRTTLAGEIKSNLAQRAELTARLASIMAAERRLEAQIASDGCAADPVSTQCRGLDALLTAARGREASTRSQLATNESALPGLKAQARQLAAKAAQLASQAGALVRQAIPLAAQAVSLQQQANGLQAQAASLQQQANSLQAQAASLQQQANAVQAQADNLKQQQQQAENEQKQALALKQQLTDELTYAGGDDRGTDPRLVKLERALATPSNVQRVSPPTINKKGDAATFTVIAGTRPAATATAALVGQLRDYVIPPAVRGSGLTAYVGGVTAGNVDLASKITSKLFEVIAVVLILSFLLLMIAFRSLLIPLQAAITNLLCVGAAFGVLTATFQYGWGLSLVGLQSPYGTVPIASYVPLMMFAALFGLSMDYEVFLVSQIAQHHAEGEEPKSAVRSGLGASAKVIAAAATIMIAVFASFILNSDPTIKQFGVGLSVAVFLAGSMMLVLAPALLVLFGRATWWMPRWLDRILPHIDVEGEGAAKKRRSPPSVNGGAPAAADRAPEPAEQPAPAKPVGAEEVR